MSRKTRILSWLTMAALATTLVLAATHRANAANTWKPDPANNLWHNAANWSDGVIPNSTTADVLFNGPSSQTTISCGGLNTNMRYFDFAGASCPAYTFTTTGMLSLYGNVTIGAEVTTNQTFASTVSFRLLAAGQRTITNNGTGLLKIDNGIMSNVAGAIAVFDGTGQTQIKWLNLRNNTYSLDVVKQGSGTLVIVDAAGGPDAYGIVYSSGTTAILGGKVVIDDEGNLGGDPGTVFDEDALLLNGGTLQATASFAINDSRRGVTVGPNGGTFEVDASRVLTIDNVIRGAGSLAKTGSGTLTLTAANLYAGATNVSQGTLALSGAGAIDGSPAISIAPLATFDVSAAAGGQYSLASGQTLLGDGSVVGNLAVAAGASISAGSSPGKLTITGDYDQDGTMLVDLWGPIQGDPVGFDWIDVSGTAQVQGLLRLVLDNGFAPQVGDTFQVLTADAISIDGPLQIDDTAATLGPVQAWQFAVVDLLAGGQALELTVSVPEPSALILLAVGLPCLPWRARRKRK